MNKAVFGAFIPVIALALGGCDKFANPASVCSAPDTFNTVKNLIIKQTTNGDDNAKPSSLILGSQFDLATLTSYDKVTKKISCSAQTTVKFPDKDMQLIKKNPDIALYMQSTMTKLLANTQYENETWHANIDYYRQPSADGSQYIYSYSDGGVIEGLADFVQQLDNAQADSNSNPPTQPAVPQPPHNPPVGGDATITESGSNSDQQMNEIDTDQSSNVAEQN